MSIDININNKNKHWILVVLEKIKNLVVKIFNFFVKILKYIGRFFKAIGKFIKKVWKVLVIILIIAFIVGSVCFCYDYYKYTYLPKKILDNAISDIENKFNSNIDSIKCKYALAVISDSYEWGYEKVSNAQITQMLSKYKDDAFRYIESKAYEGIPKCQYILGEIYHGFGCCNIIKDNYKAAYWWNEAAGQGYLQAYYKMGIAYLDGIGVIRNNKKALEFIKKGAEVGDCNAQYEYGDLFETGVEVFVEYRVEEYEKDKNYEYKTEFRTNEYTGRIELVETYEKIFDYNYKRSYRKNGHTFYVYEKKVPYYDTILYKDMEQAKYWWRKAAEQGHKGAKDKLQKIY